MASPQPDQFTKLSNEILDEICRFKFNGAQFRIIMKIWRLTYGYGRKDHEFSVTFLHETTALSEVTVKKELKTLIDSKVLKVTKEATYRDARKLAFNKNYDEWEVVGMTTKDGSEVYDRTPLEVYDHTPQVITQGYTIIPPNKEISLKKIFKENVAFDDFYFSYPRKISKQAALKAWNKLSKEEDFDPNAIITNTINFSKTCELLNTEARYIPHPSTFLNQKRYEDYPTVDPEGLAKTKQGHAMDVLANFYKEGAEREADGDSPAISGYQDSLPELPDC
jgi:phage replication O-like protein O